MSELCVVHWISCQLEGPKYKAAEFGGCSFALVWSHWRLRPLCEPPFTPVTTGNRGTHAIPKPRCPSLTEKSHADRRLEYKCVCVSRETGTQCVCKQWCVTYIGHKRLSQGSAWIFLLSQRGWSVNSGHWSSLSGTSCPLSLPRPFKLQSLYLTLVGRQAFCAEKYIFAKQ